ncbi:MAG: hypothetical protein ACK5ZG_07175 [Phycisphaerae bacterium]|jgi:hypothetical protein
MKTRVLVCAMLSVLGSASALAQVVDARLIVKVGDVTSAGPIVGLNDPFTNGSGQPGFVYNLAGSVRGIWIGTGSVFDTSALPTVTGGESTMGISDGGNWIYSPSVSGADSVYTNFGPLLVAGQPAPGFAGQFSSFSSRPRMTRNGTAAWVGGVSLTAGGATATRVFYLNRDPSDPSNTVRTLAGGDVVQGVTIAAAGIGFAFDISDDGTEYINQVTFTGPTATDLGVVVNGTTIVMREGSPSTAPGENWQGFAIVSINDAGDYLVIGDTDGPAASDGFISLNGTMVAREGQLIGGLALGGTFGAATLAPSGAILAIGTLGGVESLLVFDGVNPVSVVAKVGDTLDFDNDDLADATLNDFNASASVAPGLDSSIAGGRYVNVDITPIATGVQVEAIINLGGLSCDPIDFNNDGVFPDDQDVVDFFAVLSGSSCPACNDIDFNNNGVFPEDQDVIDFFNVLAGGECSPS